MGVFDNHTIEIPCRCGNATPMKVSDLRHNPEYTCTCGEVIAIEGNMGEMAARADAAVDKFLRSMKRLSRLR